jgi:hypothetical protein
MSPSSSAWPTAPTCRLESAGGCVPGPGPVEVGVDGCRRDVEGLGHDLLGLRTEAGEKDLQSPHPRGRVPTVPTWPAPGTHRSPARPHHAAVQPMALWGSWAALTCGDAVQQRSACGLHRDRGRASSGDVEASHILNGGTRLRVDWLRALHAGGRCPTDRFQKSVPLVHCGADLWHGHLQRAQTVTHIRRFVLHQDRKDIAAGQICNVTRVRAYVMLSGVCVTVSG